MKKLILILFLALASVACADNGLGSARDAEQIAFSKQLVAQAQREHGVVRISIWKSGGKEMFYAMRLVEEAPGVKRFLGPNPPSGYNVPFRSVQTWDVYYNAATPYSIRRR